MLRCLCTACWSRAALCSAHQKQQEVAEVRPHAVPLLPPAQVEQVQEEPLVDVEVLQKGGGYS